MKGLWLALVLGAGLAGCAVLTVDVDVYKGALVNEEEVQLRQLVALTTAAKPMLIQLRDILEWPGTDGKPYSENEDAKCKEINLRVKSWYKSKYVSSADNYLPEVEPRSVLWKTWRWITEFGKGPQPSCQPHFENPYARSVNIVLSLYEDLGSADFDPHGRKLREAVAQLDRAQKIYELDVQRDQEIFNAISKGLRKNGLSSELQDLLAAYRDDLLNPQREIPGQPIRRVGKLMSVFAKLAQSEMSKKQPKGEIESILIANWGPELEKAKGQLYDEKLGPRAVWKLLGEGKDNALLTWVTGQLCVDGTVGQEACDELNKRTKDLADAYWGVRQATRELWEESLGLLVRIERLERENSGRYYALKEKVIQVVAETTSPLLIASALERLGYNGTCSVLKNTLLHEWTRMCGDNSMKMAWTPDNVNRDSLLFTRILKEALFSTPSDTAHFLLTLDSLEKHAAPKASVAKTLVEKVNQVNSKRVVQLGLINSYIGETTKLDLLFHFVEEVSQDLANGLGRGRLSDGLHTLTEDYLKAHNDARNGVVSKAQKQLIENLVEFAQKILFLANHEGLASPPRSEGLVMGGSESILRGLFGDEIMDGTEKSNIFTQSSVPRAMTRRYVRVLQAVGNSILFSANELRERDRYREQGQKKVAAEVTAARSVYSPDSAKVITDLLAELEHDKQAAQTALDAAKIRKQKLEAELGSDTTNPKTGRYADQEKAKGELAKADNVLNAYRNSLDTLKAIHAVLTHDVIQEVISEWGTNSLGAADEGDFLISGTLSLEGTLRKVRKGNTDWDDVLRYLASSDTKQDFIAYRKLVNKASRERLELFKDFIAQIKWLIAQRVPRNEWQAKLDHNTQRIDTLKKEVADLDQQINNTLPQDKTDLETAKIRIESVKAAVLKEIDQERPFAPSKEVYARINIHLQKTNTTDDQTAQRILASRTPPPDMPPLNPKDYKSPSDVMDTVIALLRHRQMEAVERFGKDSKEAEQATEAIENAYRHRAGMIYIRPSSAYLRTSFPSTSLQDDPNLAWDNMLLKQGLRNLPFSSELRDILNPSVKQDQVLTSELDKQYWQNINRVRVSGTGFTNQALVKDDVGNWYVKQYFGDTERIWESAKNLALFSMSAKVPIDLAKQLNKASKPEEYAENSKETPTLQKVLEKHQGAYKTHTDEIKAKLERLHDKELEETLIAAWDAHKDLTEKEDANFHAQLQQALAAEIVVWNKASTKLALKEKPDQDSGQAIVKDVGALSRLGKMLSASIAKIPSSDITREENELEGQQKSLEELEAKKELKDDEKKTLDQLKDTLPTKRKNLKTKKEKLEEKRNMAVSEVNKIVGGQVKDILDDRNRILAEYEKAIVFIGDAAKQEETKQSK